LPEPSEVTKVITSGVLEVAAHDVSCFPRGNPLAETNRKGSIFMTASFKAKIAGLGVAGLLAIGGLAIAATPVSATTLTCTNVNNALVSPFGCGGLTSGTGLDLAHVNNFYNGLVTVQVDASTSTEDWTAYAVVPPTSIPATLGGHISGAQGYGEYVAMDTPDGNLPSFTDETTETCTINGNSVTQTAGDVYTNTEPCPGASFYAGPTTLCLSVESASGVPGTNGKLRWWNVLRTCNTNGEFQYGKPGTTTTPAVPGSVVGSHYNAYQVWEPVGPESGGFLMDNVWLRQHNNVPYVLDITGDGGAGTATQAYAEHDVPWEEWNIIGCTPPASLLNVSAPYVNCP
jgi:hypothetical protein